MTLTNPEDFHELMQIVCGIAGGFAIGVGFGSTVRNRTVCLVLTFTGSLAWAWLLNFTA